jgi:hypothetical protein
MRPRHSRVIGSFASRGRLSVEDIASRRIERRAVEAVIWGLPAVNYDLMYQAAVNTVKGAFNQIIYWSRLSDWKNQTLTPNPDSVYLMPFINTRAGPMVLEIPPADDGLLNGSIDDAWQAAMEDVGPAGVDQGKGGHYLILPPDYGASVPKGYIPLQSDTYQSYALLRSILKSGSETDVARAVAYAKRVKLYPIAQADMPPETKFVDASDVVFDATIPYDLHYFQSLNRMVQAEPWLTRDRVMIDMLKTIGIQKGRPFNPDARMADTLRLAVAEAHAWLESYFEELFQPPYFAASRWAIPVTPEVIEGLATFFTTPDSYPIDARARAFSMGFFSAKHLGAGQFYLMTIKDRYGNNFDGSKTYRLTVPANAPVTQYWSATAYDRVTHALIRELPRASRSSQSPGLESRSDGSVDIYFGPAAPAGKESNWVPTSASGQFEVLFRLYGPEKPLFEKTWQLPDIEPIG